MTKAILRWKAAFCLWNADVPSRDQIRDWKDSRQPPGVINHYQRLKVAGELFPGLIRENSKSVEGLVYLSITGGEWERLTAFEDDFYELQEVTVECPETSVSALAFIVPPSRKSLLSDKPWNPDFFRENPLARKAMETIPYDASVSP